MKTIYTILLVTALSMSAAVAQPGGRGDGKGWNGPCNPEQIAKQLDLTAEQTAALKAARNEMQLKMIDLRANVQKAKLTTRSLMDADTVNRDALMSAVEAESAAELAVKKAMIDQRLKAQEIIGAEKAEQLFDLVRECKGNWGKRGDRPRRGGWDDDERDGDSDRGGPQ